MKKIFPIVSLLLLGGCESIGNMADDIGTHLPTLSDERCEHWQCFTSDGQAQSDMNKKMREQRWEQEKQGEQGGQVPQDPSQQPPLQPVPAQQPSNYNPAPEMNPYDNYHP
jgi:hypothetical protein